MRGGRKFALVFANILLPVLLQERATLARATERGGLLIVSGLLREQVAEFLRAFPRRDFRLQMICGEFVALRRLFQMKQAEMNHGAVPQTAVLLLEKNQISKRIRPRGESRRLEKHQREQRVALWLCGGGIFCQRLAETDGFGAQVILDQAISRRCRVPFGEK